MTLRFLHPRWKVMTLAVMQVGVVEKRPVRDAVWIDVTIREV
jgi:hypothetical protein